MIIKKAFKRIAEYVYGHPDQYVSVNFTPLEGNFLKGKRILITGGSRGIGLAMANKFVAVGAQVIVTGRSEDRLVEATRKSDGQIRYIVNDISDTDKLDSLLDQATELFDGSITTLVSNAGISLHEDGIHSVTEKSFDKQMAIDLKAPFFLAQHFMEYCRTNDLNVQRSMLFLSSETADQGNDRPYGLAKAAINNLISGLAHRGSQLKLRVNGIAPGVTVTSMTQQFSPNADGNLAARNVPGRVYLPEEIAEVATFLVSDASLCINGEVIHCNGNNHIKTYFD